MNWLGWLGWFKRKKGAEVIPLPVKAARAIDPFVAPQTWKPTLLKCGKCQQFVPAVRTFSDRRVRCIDCADKGK